MEELFRFMLARPPREQDPEAPSIDLEQESRFQTQLVQASEADRPRVALRRAAERFVRLSRFLGAPQDNPLASKLAAFSATMDEVETRQKVTPAELEQIVTESFGDSPPRVAQQSRVAMSRLRDSLLAIKLLQEEHRRPIEALANQLRELELIGRISRENDFPERVDQIRRFRRRSLRLPDFAAISGSTLSTREPDEKRREELKRRRQTEKKALDLDTKRYETVRAAVRELTALSPDSLEATPQKALPASAPPAAASFDTALGQQAAYFKGLADLNLRQISTRADVAAQRNEGPDAASTLASKLVDAAAPTVPGSPAFKPLLETEGAFVLKTTTARVLSAPTHAMLRDNQIAIDKEPLDRAVETLERESERLGRDLAARSLTPVRTSLKRFGSTLVVIKTPAPDQGFAPLLDASLPETRGSVEPSGITDLLIVKQQLTGYEAADVAHIENVLRGENKVREHVRRSETEEFTFRETELTTEEERELESTTRFEMSRETSETIRQDASLKAGLTVSGKYGPTVEFSASAEGAVSRSKTESTKAASSFSQDVTQRSSSKISERVLERVSRRVTNEVTETNRHELNNVPGSAGHISGVYQWVSKVYEAQVYNYGIRTMFDFMVPEPGAFLIAAMNSEHASALEIEKPAKFKLRPHQISDNALAYGYYGKWAQIYGATDLVAPPEIYKTKSFDFSAGGGDSKTNYQYSEQIAIDDGYKAVQGTMARVRNIWGDDELLDVALGRKTHRFDENSPWVWTTPLSEERDSIPVALGSFKLELVGVAVEVKCQRTSRAMEMWRIDTHAKLTNAYKARQAEYEEKMAALEMQAGVSIEGANPALNLEVMKDELKKNCISILTDQHFDLFGAVRDGMITGLPEIDVNEAEIEGRYVRFFEQAFEWEHLQWVTYPYFWGRKSEWRDRIAYEDTDPRFNEFLKAGFCRVTVPARPGFEGAIDHFMTFGETWNGGPLPAISNPLYLGIADELAERLDRPGDEFREGEPWMVRIPTTLVHLRSDDKLPKWEKDAMGEWVEV